MGNQSLLVVTGFILLHIALIVNLVALGSQNWIQTDSANSSSIQPNTTANFSSQGLWQLCVYGEDSKECTKLAPNQPAWFVAVQVIYTLGCAITFLALMGYYILFIRASNNSETTKMNNITLALITIACTCLIIGIALFGKWAVDEYTTLQPPKEFGWSYYLAISGSVIAVLTAIVIGRETFILRSTRRPYEDI